MERGNGSGPERESRGRPKHVKVLGPLCANSYAWLIAGNRASASGSRRPIDLCRRTPRKGLRTHQLERRWRGEVFPPSYRGSALVGQHGWRTRQPLSRPLPDTPLRSHPRFHDRGRRWGATQSPAVVSVTGGIRPGATAAESCALHCQKSSRAPPSCRAQLARADLGPDAAHSESARQATQTRCPYG